MSAAGRRVVVGLATLAAMALLLPVAGGPVLAKGRVVGRWILGRPAWLVRAAGPSEERPFRHLAASQVGYRPSHRKEFTSPEPFSWFRVVNATDGKEVLRGGPPNRAIPTELLGDQHPVVWVGDFTALREPGRYRLETDRGLRSHPFDVGERVFAPAVRAVQRALYYQRAFTAIEPPWAEPAWTHPSDGPLAPPGVEGGWHDAGDLSLYSATTMSTIFWLLSAFEDFSPGDDDLGIPESGNGVPDLLDEARWGLRWLLSTQDEAGGFSNATCQTAYGPYGTNRPDRMAPYVAGEVGTLATARAVGTLGFASAVFRRHDPAFAARSLAAARRGWRFLAVRPTEHSDGPTCPAFRMDGDAAAGRALRAYAAAGLLVATAEPAFATAFDALYRPVEGDPSYLNPGGYAALLYLRAEGGHPDRRRAIRAELRGHAEAALADGAAHPFGWATRYLWGSVNAGFLRTGPFSVRVCVDDAEARAHCEQALANLQYALGRNYLNLVHVTGLPGVTRGRTHVFHHWIAALGTPPGPFPGLVGAGPNANPHPDDVSHPSARPLPLWGYLGDPRHPRGPKTPLEGRLTENDSWSTNELDIEWQATMLYHLHFAARGR